jgi:cyclopropane-fatty-acyl-phospholipid synthase
MASESTTMRTVSMEAGDVALCTAREILCELFGEPAGRTFAVRLWDGSTELPDRSPAFTLILRTPSALRRMLWLPNERRLGDAYVRNELDIDGNLEAAVALTETIARRASQPLVVARLLWHLRRLRHHDVAVPEMRTAERAYGMAGTRHSRVRDASAVRRHYDIGNDFYRLWLDRSMVYSCAYFPRGDETLDAAQDAKLDLVCRKLRLRAGERLLDIGCGWGALVLHAAEHYGVDATGITLSREQAAWVRERIAAAKLGDRCRVKLLDYRDLSGTLFDKIASLGMVEHVGRAMLPTYFSQAFRLLTPGGLFLNHGIVALDAAMAAPRSWLARRIRRWNSFIEANVFPDGELVAPAEMLAPATAAGFEMRDVESLREHYALTLRQWVHRLEARRDEVAVLVGEATYRVWRAYMAGSAHAFASGRLGVVQMLLGKQDANGVVHLPSTRADLYAQMA